MPFGFFSRLHYRTRDSILEGAMEAAQILEHGPDDKTFRTETVEAIEAEEGGAALPRLTAPKTVSGGHADTSNASQKKPPASTNSANSQRRPRRTAKTEAMFDVSEDSLP